MTTKTSLRPVRQVRVKCDCEISVSPAIALHIDFTGFVYSMVLSSTVQELQTEALRIEVFLYQFSLKKIMLQKMYDE